MTASNCGAEELETYAPFGRFERHPSRSLEGGRAVRRAETDSLLALALLLAVQEGPQKLPSPVVGQIAPPLGYVEWMQLEGKALGARSRAGPKLQDLRGKVVIVHTYGYYCDS